MIVITILQSIKQKKIKMLDMIANYSFGIYFLHYLLFEFLWRVYMRVFHGGGEFFWSIIFTITPVIILTMLLVGFNVLKKLIKTKSRIIVGI